MNYNQHLSRINRFSNNRSNEEQSNEPFRFNIITEPQSSIVTGISNQNSIERPVTRSLVKRNLQQQQQNASVTTNLDMNHNVAATSTNSFLDSSSSNYDPNDLTSSNNENILKLIQLRHQQIPTPPPPQKTYQKIIVNEKPCNIINIFENSRINGRMIKNISNLPDTTLSLVSQRLKTHDYPLLIKRLDQSSITINLRTGSKEVDDILRILQEVENRLMNYVSNTGNGENDDSPNNTIREEFEVETINVESARVFRQYGGIEIFKRILLLNLLIADNNPNLIYSNVASSSARNISSVKNTNNFSFLNNINNNSSSININASPSLISNRFLNRTIPETYNQIRNSKDYHHHQQQNTNISFNNKNKNFISNYIEKGCILKIKCKCIHILNRLVCLPNYGKLIVNDLLQLKTNKNPSSPLTTTIVKNSFSEHTTTTSNNYDTTLLQYLFTLLMFKESRLQVCQLIESILLHIPMLNLNRISNIKLILESIDDDGLSCICKIFAVTLSNLDMNEKKYLANNQKRIQIQKQRAAAASQQAASTISSTTSNPGTSASTSATAESTPTTSAASSTSNLSQTFKNNFYSNTSSQPSAPPLSIRDQNQELLLKIPTLLFRLVNLVRRKDYAIRYADANSEIEHWIRYIDQALSDTEDNDIGTSTTRNQQSIENISHTNINSVNYFNTDFNSTSNESSTNSQSRSLSRSGSRSTSPNILNRMYENISNQPALLAAAKLNNFVYVLYTLSLLLIGKEKKKVQVNLTKLRLASALNSLFDYLIWNCRCEYPNSAINNSNNNPVSTNVAVGAINTNTNQPAINQQQQQQQQMRSHICPEVAVKIQFLRLVHSFCDHSESKRVVLSRLETDEILNYNRICHPCLRVDEQILKVENRFRCTKENVGLLSKIVQVIKQEPFSASFRFWLIRAIESFLRGNTSYADQLFLIKRGIVEDTVQNILAINFTRPKEVLQSCFDMLGELVKFNMDGFEILNKELADPEKFNMLFTMINQSLIDSNMFLRSIFLSIDFFENNSSSLDYKFSNNKILNHFNLFDRRVVFLCRMINIININNLSQENVSCLNTTLIVLMLANRKKILPKYLLAIKAKSIEMLMANDLFRVNNFTNNLPTTSISNNNSSPSTTASSSPPLDIVTNFRDLLIFWQSHYLQKDKDCGGLEQNSRIDFSYWKETVELLLDPNPKNEWSLNFYLQNDLNFMPNNNKNRIDELRSD